MFAVVFVAFATLGPGADLPADNSPKSVGDTERVPSELRHATVASERWCGSAESRCSPPLLPHGASRNSLGVRPKIGFCGMPPCRDGF